MNAQMTALTHKMDNLGAAIWNGAPMGPCGACGQMGYLSQDCQQGPTRPHQPDTTSTRAEKQSKIFFKFIAAIDTRLQNQDASIRNLEVQIGKLVSIVFGRREGQLPSDTEKNSREQVNAIFVRNERAIGDEPPKEQVEEAQAKKEEESQEETKGSPFKLNLDAIPPYIPYPERILKANVDKQFGKFLEIFKKIHVNIPLIDALSQMPSSAKFLKEVLSNKRKWEKGDTVKLNEECSAIFQNKLPPKLKDTGSFSIPCTIGNIDFDKILCDLGASVILMPYSIFEKLGMHELTPSIITLQLADRSIKYPRGIVEDVLVKVGNFIIPVDFIVLDMEKDKNIPLILGRPFLATSRALINVQKGRLTLRVNDEHVVFNVFKPIKYLHKKEHDIFAIDIINTFGTDNVHLVKCEDPKEDYIENSNEDNLQDMKEEHEEVSNFVDTGQEMKSKLQKELLLNGSTSNQKAKPPLEVSSDRKKASEDKWVRPNRMKNRWRNQVDKNDRFYKEHTKAWNESHKRKKKFKDGDKRHHKNKSPIKVDWQRLKHYIEGAPPPVELSPQLP
ncbi:UNVERIFIED_CONTAM: hypothetical protein Sradi_3820500 [Sesamum radiatum]|uniref:CCHC-type domain-containing protein n=1 Tax=Sesamum radiatum TaxID=300843 RepID=A0AAW2Q0X5_SESRA